MDPRPPHRAGPAPSRGVTLLEAMVSLTILLVGILGTMQLQVVGISANAGARSQTQALQLARELAAALEALSPTDPRLAHHYDAPTPPPEFGHLLVAADTIGGAFTAYTDGLGLPGVTSEATVRAVAGSDPLDDTLPRFQRRYQVWQLSTAAAASGIKAVAVSVTYREPRLPGLREVVLLTQVSNKGLSSAFASAYR